MSPEVLDWARRMVAADEAFQAERVKLHARPCQCYRCCGSAFADARSTLSTTAAEVDVADLARAIVDAEAAR